MVGFEKLAEGGFNRSFLVTRRDNFRFVARIPYPVTQPKSLIIASELATMDFLRSHGIPVPKVYGYSASADNPAETEYIFMELIQGQNLGDICFDLSERQRAKLIAKLVQLQSRLFALRFPASGSLYYCTDLPESNKVVVPSSLPTNEGRFCIGPDTSLGLWYGRRLNLPVERGPCEYLQPPALGIKQRRRQWLRRQWLMCIADQDCLAVLNCRCQKGDCIPFQIRTTPSTLPASSQRDLQLSAAITS